MSEITKVREALLAQHFEDIDKLSDKIVGAADKIERATAALNGTSRAPANSKPAARPAAQPLASWGTRAFWLGAALAGVIVSAGIGAIVARNQPLQTADQVQITTVGRGLVQAWPKLDQATQQRLWSTLDNESKESLTTALRH